MVLLHQAVDLEPVGSPAVPAAGLGHADTEALFEPARLAGGPVALVNHADVVVFALRDHSLIIAESSEEALAALTGEGAEVEASRLLVAHAAELVLEAVHVVHRLRHHRLPWKLMLAVQIRDHGGSEQYALDVLDPLKSLCC